ncbi:LysE family translocator [Streptomyces sp. NPDC058459]|uniref:LysE family translocator n=1 Tax=Streptomyces sp. NPDC058459 TaxID=3346508 RepID=UPI0036600FFD
MTGMSTVLLELAVTWGVLLASPGPDTLAVVQSATTASRRDGLLTAVGVISGITLWLVTAMTGLSTLLTRVEWLYDVLRVFGAGYLAYIGVTSVRSALRMPRTAGNPFSGTAQPRTGFVGWQAWRRGFLTNAGNPKAAVFFVGLFAGLLPVRASAQLRIAVLLLMIVMATLWYFAVAFLVSLAPVFERYQGNIRTINLVTGGVFLVFAGVILLGV